MNDSLYIYKKLEIFAKSCGIKLTTDTKILTSLLLRMEETEKQFGILICPCNFINKLDKREIVKNTRCPCLNVFDDIDKHGKCHCGLFEKL